MNEYMVLFHDFCSDNFENVRMERGRKCMTTDLMRKVGFELMEATPCRQEGRKAIERKPAV